MTDSSVLLVAMTTGLPIERRASVERPVQEEVRVLSAFVWMGVTDCLSRV